VSRLEFRVAVDSPRPRSALAMVALASGALALTGQIQLWTLMVAVFALAWAMRRGARRGPPPGSATAGC
jgi:hypothetical protein